MNSPSAISSITGPAAITGPKLEQSSGGDPFREAFQSAVAEVARFQNQAAQSADRFLRGEGEEIHQVALDAQRAELAFDLFLQARNKVVDAYQEIMRMQL
jgi:flagellar hook-basal body complex protein FliE